MPLGYNKVLGDCSKPAEARPHRIAIGGWSTMMANWTDPRNSSLPALLGHLQSAGYEGLEFSASGFARYFPGDSQAVVATKARRECEKFGLSIFGATLYIGDEAPRKLHWIDSFIEEMKLIKEMGGGFASYQFNLNADYLNTGGAYREDEEYLRWCGDQVSTLRENAWKLGLNFYLEVHVDRITEDPAGLCRILELSECELNGDMSHFFFRGITKGQHLQKIVDHLGHTHTRIARSYGDLSAGVPDPKADWQAKGATWGLFQLMKPALAKGLSSRTITGETGPMHLVTDTLTQDAALVPLWRAMARYADAGAQGIVMKVDEPGDLKPWG